MKVDKQEKNDKGKNAPLVLHAGRVAQLAPSSRTHHATSKTARQNKTKLKKLKDKRHKCRTRQNNKTLTRVSRIHTTCNKNITISTEKQPPRHTGALTHTHACALNSIKPTKETNKHTHTHTHTHANSKQTQDRNKYQQRRRNEKNAVTRTRP